MDNKRERHEHPEPAPGYPSLAAFMGSDADFFVVRGFRRLAARDLLHRQDELAELEEKLDAIDQADGRSGTPAALWNLHSHREDMNARRRELAREIRGKLANYRE